MRGIDLSHWNAEMGINILKDDSIELDFVILKHSEGQSISDTMFERYLLEARNRGICTNGYHFYVGNVFTDVRRDMIISRMRDISRVTRGIAFIDWEREIDALNAIFIFKTMEEYMRQTGERCGLYASYNVFNRTDLFEDGMTLAKHCWKMDVPIWCARYKLKSYVKDLEGFTGINSNAVQKTVGDIPISINQITDKCLYKGQKINLDYNVAYRKFW